MKKRDVFVFVTALAVWITACDEKKKPISQPSPASTSVSKTVIDQYGELWDQVGYSNLVLTAHVYPIRAGLELDSTAPSGERDRLVALLTQSQPAIARLMDLSRQPLEPFPPMIMPGPHGDEHLKHPSAWIQNFGRLLNADAGRCWNDGDADGAARRVAAGIRLGQGLSAQPESTYRIKALGISGVGMGKALAICQSGLLDRASPEALNDLRAAVDSVQLTEETPELTATIRLKLDELRSLLSAHR